MVFQKYLGSIWGIWDTITCNVICINNYICHVNISDVSPHPFRRQRKSPAWCTKTISVPKSPGITLFCTCDVGYSTEGMRIFGGRRRAGRLVDTASVATRQVGAWCRQVSRGSPDVVPSRRHRRHPRFALQHRLSARKSRAFGGRVGRRRDGVRVARQPSAAFVATTVGRDRRFRGRRRRRHDPGTAAASARFGFAFTSTTTTTTRLLVGLLHVWLATHVLCCGFPVVVAVVSPPVLFWQSARRSPATYLVDRQLRRRQRRTSFSWNKIEN